MLLPLTDVSGTYVASHDIVTNFGVSGNICHVDCSNRGICNFGTGEVRRGLGYIVRCTHVVGCTPRYSCAYYEVLCACFTVAIMFLIKLVSLVFTFILVSSVRSFLSYSPLKCSCFQGFTGVDCATIDALAGVKLAEA